MFPCVASTIPWELSRSWWDALEGWAELIGLADGLLEVAVAAREIATSGRMLHNRSISG